MTFDEISLKVSNEVILLPFKYLCSYASGYNSLLFSYNSNKVLRYSNTEYDNNGLMIRKEYLDFMTDSSNLTTKEEVNFIYKFEYDSNGRVTEIFNKGILKYMITYTEATKTIQIIEFIKNSLSVIVPVTIFVIYVDYKSEMLKYQKFDDSEHLETVKLYKGHITYGYNILYASLINKDIPYFETEYRDDGKLEFFNVSYIEDDKLGVIYYKYNDSGQLSSIHDATTVRYDKKFSNNILFENELVGSFEETIDCDDYHVGSGGRVHYSNEPYRFDAMYEDLKRRIISEVTNND